MFPAIAILSAAALGFEVLIMRLYSIVQWHNSAYMMISLALLGYGASGTFLSFARTWLLARFHVVFPAAAGLFGLTALLSFTIAQRVPLNALEVVWDRGQLVYFLLVYLLLAVPFFFAATAIGLALARHKERIGLVYRSDLVGAGLGGLGIIGVLSVVDLASCLKLIGGLGCLAAAVGAWQESKKLGGPTALVAGAVALMALWPTAWVAPQPSPYKDLSLALSVPGARVVAKRSGPLGLITAVESPTIPFRYAPGLSLNATAEPPQQIGLFTDGGGMTAITRFDGRRETIAYLDQQTSALPYHLLRRPRVLVLGAGGGADVLMALYHDAAAVDAVELNPHIVDLVRREFADFAGNIYGAGNVTIHTAEARSFITATRRPYDLIQVALLDSFSVAAAGLHALSESTLYTVEALDLYLGRLRPGGLLAFTRWLRLPSRDALKLFATAALALEQRGVAEPRRRLAMIRGWKTTTLIVKNGDLTAQDIAALRAFADERSFDVAYYPGMTEAEANRYNILERPYLYRGATALLGPGREAYFRDYKYDVRPTDDDRPYFFHFLKWPVIRELLTSRVGIGLQPLDWGYLILLATLVQAAIASLVLILLPLAARRRARPVPGRERAWVFLYFGALGLAFLSIEIAFIQRFVLFLGHPLFAVAVVLSSLLVFAGLGSGWAPSACRRMGGARETVLIAVTGIGLIAIFYLGGLTPLFEWMRPWPIAARVMAAIALIAPLGFFMGMPFPIGLARCAERAPELVPWAWGINGCASVLSAVLATLLAIQFGFTVVVVLAVLLYGGASASLALSRPHTR